MYLWLCLHKNLGLASHGSELNASVTTCVWSIITSSNGGKSGHAVQLRSAHVRIWIRKERHALERIPELRKKREGVLSSLSAKRREINNLLTDKNNSEAVKMKLLEIPSRFRKFAEAQHTYNAALTDEGERQESEA